MKKIKKILIAFKIFIIGIFLKSIPVLSMSFYGGPIEDDIITTNNKETLTSNSNNVSEFIINIIVQIIVFSVGLFILSKKKMKLHYKILILLTLSIITAIICFMILK